MRKSLGESTFDKLNLLFLGLVGFICLFPFYYIIIYSISDAKEAIKGVFLLPRGFSLESYRKVFASSDIVHATFISLSRTIIGTIGTILCSALFAYGVTKEVLPGRRFMYRATVIMMYISVGIIPVYITYQSFGLTNNFLVYVLPNLVAPFLIVLSKTYFEQLPKELEESAMMDGCGYFRIFYRIIMPLSTPILATIGIFQAVYLWNSYYDNLYFTFGKSELTTLPLILFNYVNQSLGSALANKASRGSTVIVTPTSIRMTVTVITALPILAVYPFLQRYFLKGLLVGAVKG